MKIKITEKQFDYIIKQKVNEQLCSEALSFFMEHDVKNSVHRDFLFENIKFASLENPISLWQMGLTEGLMRTFPIEKTAEYVKKYFELNDSQVLIVKNYNNIQCIQVIIPNVNNNVKMVVGGLKMCGYFLSYPKLENLKENEWQILQFEPIHQNDITKELKEKEDVLYHITPSYNYKKIKHIGLSPKTKNNLFDYPDRIYFTRGSAGINKIITIGWALCDKNNSKGNEGKYSIIEVDLNNISNNVTFYYDPNFEYGVYSTDNIHPSSLKLVGEFDYKELEERLKNENK